MPMGLTDSEYLDWLAGIGAEVAKCDTALMRESLAVMLKAADIDLWDLRRLGSGDYTLCDGYCQGS